MTTKILEREAGSLKGLELSLEDVFIYPRYFKGTSRMEVDLTPADVPLGSNPIVSANMNAVTGKRMAETVARYGGIGILPQDMAPDVVEAIIRHVKSSPVYYDTALSVDVDRASVREVQGIINKRSHGVVVAVDAMGRPVGVVTENDLKGREQYLGVDRIINRQIVTIPESEVVIEGGYEQAHQTMERSHVKVLPVVNGDGRLTGILTREDCVRFALFRPTVDASGRLGIGVAIGISNAQTAADLACQYVNAGADLIVFDTAHGHQSRMTETLRYVREQMNTGCLNKVPIVAGNVCTRQGTRDLIEAGADIVKVNVGPGAMCTTRMQTGVGRPTFTSVLECADEARVHNRWVWADGGVRHPRDLCLYLAAGASRVMVGSLFSGTYESPGDLSYDSNGRKYKINYGMASSRAVQDRNSTVNSFERAKKMIFSEGISTSRIYLQEGREGVGDLMMDFIAGLRSSCTYCDATDLKSFFRNSLVGVQTSRGYHEGTPHGRVMGWGDAIPP